MAITFGKILSLIIALIYLLIAISTGSWRAITACAILVLPLALIWFPEDIGSFKGYVGRGGNIDQKSAPIVASTMGWFFLVGMPLLLAYIWR
jgi:hypothetical protein